MKQPKKASGRPAIDIERALREATNEQIASENARRNQAKRKVRTGGRNGGRPKKP